MLTKKIAIIIPYFGKLNSKGYFQKFLNSCKKNPEVEWLLYINDEDEYDYPSNVHVTICSFEDIVKRVQAVYDFEITLTNPYKLCDFKPAYGEIFYNDIRDYDWWGFSDIDLLWGNISHFIDDNLLESYEQLYSRGHLTLMRNTMMMRTLYRDLNGRKMYENIFSDSKHYAFDELHIDGGYREIVRLQEVKVYDELDFADISKDNRYNPFCFELAQVELKCAERKKSFSVFKNTKETLERVWYYQGQKNKSEHLYIHMQKRFIKDCCPLNHDNYYIVPNRIISSDAELTRKGQVFCQISLSNLAWGGKMQINKFKKKVSNRLKLYAKAK